MTVKDLQQVAKEAGLSGYSALKKAELIELVKKA
ncbi:MAG: Rho termination factor N-terminal domain-containing protein [bacterium]|nr:Rho termination factor N-terminal domain-containing protein [bacterium]